MDSLYKAKVIDLIKEIEELTEDIRDFASNEVGIVHAEDLRNTDVDTLAEVRDMLERTKQRAERWYDGE